MSELNLNRHCLCCDNEMSEIEQRILYRGEPETMCVACKREIREHMDSIQLGYIFDIEPDYGILYISDEILNKDGDQDDPN